MIRAAIGRATREGPLISSLVCRPSYSICGHPQRNSYCFLHEDTPKIAVSSSLSFQSLKSFHSEPPNRGWFSPKDDVTWLGRTLYKLGFTEIPKSLLLKAGYLLYMKVADELDYIKFFKNCNLPDTYASWFTVLELHVWLLAARLMQNGKEGRIVRNAVINAMWEDNETKSKKLEGALPAARRRDLRLLHEQFNAALISYDEGLLSDDHVLAGALWRRMLRYDDDSQVVQLQPHHFVGESHEMMAKRVKALEMLVIYVRSQYYMLNNLSREDLLRRRAIKWAPFDDSLYQLTNKIEKSSSTSTAKAMKMR